VLEYLEEKGDVQNTETWLKENGLVDILRAMSENVEKLSDSEKSRAMTESLLTL
jgi:hypothetical protein